MPESSAYSQTRQALRAAPATWLVTGAAGFIGSHLLEILLKLDQSVVGLDNFSTGDPRNLEDVRSRIDPAQWDRFRLLEGDIRDAAQCKRVCTGVDYVLHEAAFISVPQSIEDPIACNAANVDGFLNILCAARDAGVRRLVYASSSAVYGDCTELPAREARIGKPLSPYGTSKLIDELYADVFTKNYRIETVGLRYFNVFGPRQNPTGGYAAVIPAWISTLVRGERCRIHGDGEITRDFCHVENIAQANILAAVSQNPATAGSVFNVGLGAETTLNRLHRIITEKLDAHLPGMGASEAIHDEPRAGDIERSVADISKIRDALGFEPQVSVDQGLEQTVGWYASRCA